jgi:hypothetical protein
VTRGHVGRDRGAAPPRISRPVLLVAIITAGIACNDASVGFGTEGGAAADAAFKPVASVNQVMDSIIIPSSQAIFDAVVYDNGELVQAPKSDDDWYQLRMHALAVAEAGNLLLMPPRLKHEANWVKWSHALTDAAVRVEQAADARNVDLLLETGGQMYTACTQCHANYLMEQP